MIISGEHSVVYGHPALVMAIDKRVYASFKARRDPSQESIDVKISSEEENKAESVTEILSTEVNKDSQINDEMKVEQKLLNHIYKDLAKSIGEGNRCGGSIEILTVTELPIGAGLGSSAAWGASLSASIFHSIYFILHGEQFKDQGAEKEHVWSYTNVSEKYFHGKPSGCDVASTIHGDIIYFKKGTPPEFNEIKPLPRCKVDNLDMILVQTNVKK